MFSELKNRAKKLSVVNGLFRWYQYKTSGKSHRSYVGGKWDEIGKLQFDYMVKQGLKPDHVFLDIACGALRGGRYFINYLDKGHYLGIDHNKWLINNGLTEELPPEMASQKQPTFVVSSKFEFHKFSASPDYALALSLFTHLVENDILLCLSKLRSIMKQDGKFYATFNNRNNTLDYDNPDSSGDSRHFEYTPEEMKRMGDQTGWKSNYIGGWGHPRNQEMICFYL